MRRFVLFAAVLVLLGFVTLARAIDATVPLLCGLVDVFDCSGTECAEVESEVVGVPDLMRIDPGKKLLTALDAEFDHAATHLESVSSAGGKTAVRARAGDRTLVLVVEKASGDAMMTVSDPKMTLVAFGECVIP